MSSQISFHVSKAFTNVNHRARLTYLWHLLAGDEFPPLREWPELWSRIFFNPHKTHSDRFRLFVFLWQNGMMPSHALFWVFIGGNYDASAYAHVFVAYNDTFSVDGREKLNRNRVYNFFHRRVM